MSHSAQLAESAYGESFDISQRQLPEASQCRWVCAVDRHRQLTDAEAAWALSLYTTRVADVEASCAALAQYQHKLTDIQAV